MEETNTNQGSVETGGVAVATEPKAAEALARRAAEVSAVPEGELLQVNVDVKWAVATVLGSLPEIAEHRAAIALLPHTNQALVDGLEDYALATQEATVRYLTGSPRATTVVALNEEAMRLRETLRVNATVLAHHGLIDGGRVAGIKGLVGYKNVASDVMAYATVLLDAWPAVEGKVPLTKAEVLRAKEVGTELLYAAGLKDQAPERVAGAALTRAKAFTLFMKAYDEVRRAVAYVRWHEGDADEIAPSVYAGRVRRGSAGNGASAGTGAASTTGATAVEAVA